jgi:uncharacterized protein (TIGR03437 family)
MLTARLQGGKPGMAEPSGSILLVDASTNQVLGKAPLAGSNAMVVVPASTEARTFIAVYPGDERFLESSSASRQQFAIVNAASYRNMVLAPGQIATVFSPDLNAESQAALFLPLPAKLNGVSVTLLDSSGITRQALLYQVSPKQLSFLVPPETALGPAAIRIELPSGRSISAAAMIGLVSPGVFSANADGQGVASAQIVRVHPDDTQELPENIATYDSATKMWIPAAIRQGSRNDRLFLVLYATGIRNHSKEVRVAVNGLELPSLYAGAHSIYPGLDQINVLLPADLLGTGAATVSLVTESGVSNSVALVFQ